MNPTDPLFGSQWHFTQLGLNGGELLINRIWNEFDGTGISVGVYDDGIEINHFDLDNNYDASRSIVINGQVISGNVTDTQSTHGTSVAGLIAAESNNGETVGVAFGAHVTSINIFDPLGPVYTNSTNPLILDNFYNAMGQGANFDIINNSWGSTPEYTTEQSLNDPSSGAFLLNQQYQFLSANGRNGLGTVILQAAGNDAVDANGDGVNASRFTITVSAIHNDGFASSYSNYGASVLVAAASGDYSDVRGGLGIVTTDRTGTTGYNLRANPSANVNYTDDFGGTSAATPIVSGVVALMLDANPNLGWRDVQNILAASADHTGSSINATVPADTEANTWFLNHANNWNGGGMHFSEDYGYGKVNVFAAVRMAEIWGRFGVSQTSQNETHLTTSPAISGSTAIVDASTSVFSFQIAGNQLLEHVDLTVTATHGSFGELDFFLVSPAGTEVQLAHGKPVPATTMSGSRSWTFGVDALRGELLAGIWQLKIVDLAAGNSGILQSVTFDTYGSTPSINNVYHYTEEFFGLAVLDAGRYTLNDSNGGIDWIDASAMIKPININYSYPGYGNATGLQFVSVGFGADIENIVTGDGDDIILGNALANIILGMRGNDTIGGQAGSDILDGGANTAAGDTLAYRSSAAAVVVNLGNNTASGGDAQGDTISNFENLQGSEHSDTLTGNANANVINGDNGNDLISGGAGADNLDGGANTTDGDTLGYASSSAGVSINLATNTAQAGDAQGDIISNFENVTGSAFGDQLVGDGNANVLKGGSGNDLFVGGLGADTMIGGADLDVVDYSSFATGVSINLIAGTGVGGDLISEIENITGSAFGDVLQGDNGANTMRGGVGNDFMVAGNGADLLIGGADNDEVSYETATTGVFVNLIAGTGANGGVLQQIENIRGSAFGDVLQGDNGANTIRGLAGNDFIIAGNGADLLIGGADNDTVSYETATSGIFANLATGVGANGGVLQEIENLTGSAFGDVLMGSITGNTLKGGAGNDFIVGNNGSDALFGGADNDTFRFDTAIFGNDVIADFVDNADKISFGNLVATSFGQLTILNNNSLSVTVQVIGQSIVVQSLSNITFTVSDFLFV